MTPYARRVWSCFGAGRKALEHGRISKGGLPSGIGLVLREDRVLQYTGGGWSPPTVICYLARHLPETCPGPADDGRRCRDHYTWKPGFLVDEPRPLLGHREVWSFCEAANLELRRFGLSVRLAGSEETSSAFSSLFLVEVSHTSGGRGLTRVTYHWDGTIGKMTTNVIPHQAMVYVNAAIHAAYAKHREKLFRGK